MLNSLRTRLFVTYLLLILLLLGIIGTAYVFLFIQNPASYKEAIVKIQAVVGAFEIRPQTDQLAAEGLEARMDRLAQENDVRILFFSLDKKILHDTEPQADFKFPINLVRNLPGGRIMNLRAEVEVYLYTCIRLPEAGLMVILLERPELPLSVIFGDDSIIQLFQAGLIGVAVSIILAWLMGRWILRPLNTMRAQFEKLARGEGMDLEFSGPTEFKEFSRQFNGMAERLTSSQRSQKDFVANVSHELKTPLTSIQGFSQAMIDGTIRNEEELKKSAEIIHDEAGRMYRMVIDLLDLAKFDAGTVEMVRSPLELDRILNAVIHKLEPIAAERQVRLEKQYEELPRMVGDGDRLVQVFNNIIENAIKFTRPEGAVQIKAVLIRGWIEVSVCDEGPGIEQEQIVRLFERFYQVDASRKGGKQKGAGLGLAIAHQIVEAHRGEIRVRSKRGEGSVFTIRFPIILPDDDTLAIESPYLTE